MDRGAGRTDETRRAEHRDILGLKFVIPDGLKDVHLTLQFKLLTEFNSEILQHAYEDKLYGYFWYKHGIMKATTGKAGLGYLHCFATFSNGQEWQGARRLGVVAHFLDASGSLIIQVPLGARVSDPAFSSSGAEEEHVASQHGLTVEQRDAISGVRLIWTSDLDAILAQLMNGTFWHDNKNNLIPIYPVPDFDKWIDLIT